MKGKFSSKVIPIWLLSFLFINILYIIFKDVVFYSLSIVLFAFIIYLKIKNKAHFIMLELIIFAISIVILIICAFNKDQIAFKLLFMNLENWILLYLFSKNPIK